jgi:hypothetical protein
MDLVPALRAPRVLTLSPRDRRIMSRARAKLAGARVDFDEAVRALREAVEEEIPAGRIFFLGAGEEGPIIGSIVSGVGICQKRGAIVTVRVPR